VSGYTTEEARGSGLEWQSIDLPSKMYSVNCWELYALTERRGLRTSPDPGLVQEGSMRYKFQRGARVSREAVIPAVSQLT